MKVHVQLSFSASASVPVTIPDKVIMEITGGVPFDGENEEHLNGLADALWDYDVDTPSLCHHCSGWNQQKELELGDDFEVTGAYVGEQ